MGKISIFSIDLSSTLKMYDNKSRKWQRNRCILYLTNAQTFLNQIPSVVNILKDWKIVQWS